LAGLRWRKRSEINILKIAFLFYLSRRIYIILERNFMKFWAKYLITGTAVNENPIYYLVILFETKPLVRCFTETTLEPKKL
jgi:hypothetical protein